LSDLPDGPEFVCFRLSAGRSAFYAYGMPRLLVATKNAHKTVEIAAILGKDWEVVDLTGYPEAPSPEETGETFAENAAIKAVAASLLFEGLVLSDDSGLEVDALGGAPGVYSARYAGAEASDADNREKLLRELAPHRRDGGPCAARFRCVMAIAERGKTLGTFDGAVEGEVIDNERGAGGFGYDALFIPAGSRQTFAELPAEVKNRHSHRARALVGAAEFLCRMRGKPDKKM
jgi:XTP/dITP diphosphohydrolase